MKAPRKPQKLKLGAGTTQVKAYDEVHPETPSHAAQDNVWTNGIYF